MNGRNILAVLRGIDPASALAVGEALVSAGITRLEITLDSTQPLECIEMLAEKFQTQATVGAGTVIDAQQVAKVASAGGKFIVSPHTDLAIIKQTKEQQLISIAGAITPSECMQAIGAGTDAIKLFPVSIIGMPAVRSIREILPPNTTLYAVGSIATEDFGKWFAASVDGFGIGTSLYRPGRPIEQIAQRAQQIVEQYDLAQTAYLSTLA